MQVGKFMLDELKKLYVQQADLIPDWKKYSKNELCNLYIKHENDYLGEAFLAAIFCKYWNKLSTLFNTSKPAATIEDCYEWMVESILYALKNRKWLEEGNKLFNDPNGPDKVINRVIASRRATFFQQLLADKRRVSIAMSSMDKIQEETNDYLTPYEDNVKGQALNMDLIQLVHELFDKKEYFSAFFVDAILNGDCFSPDENDIFLTKFDVKKCAKYIKNVPDDYGETFAEQYDLDLNLVNSTLKYIRGYDSAEYQSKIKYVVNVLKRTDFVKEMCHVS